MGANGTASPNQTVIKEERTVHIVWRITAGLHSGVRAATMNARSGGSDERGPPQPFPPEMRMDCWSRADNADAPSRSAVLAANGTAALNVRKTSDVGGDAGGGFLSPGVEVQGKEQRPSAFTVVLLFIGERPIKK